MRSSISIKKIAETAGVSPATVSRVLNEKGLVSHSTTEKVRNVMKEHNMPPFAPRLTSRISSNLRHRTVLYLQLNIQGSWGETTLGHSVLAGITHASRRHNINVVTDCVENLNAIPALLQKGKVDGVILHGLEPGEPLASRLREFPVTWIFYRGAYDWGDRVMPDHRQVGELALEYFVSKGCKSVCSFTYMQTEKRYWRERTNAFEQYARTANIHCVTLGEDVPQPATVADLHRKAGQFVEQFTKLKPRPEAIFVSTNLGTYVHEHLHRHGIVPMKDVLLVAGDLEVSMQHMEPEPIKVDIHSEALGRAAVELLLARISDPSLPRFTHSMSCDLLIPKENTGSDSSSSSRDINPIAARISKPAGEISLHLAGA